MSAAHLVFAAGLLGLVLGTALTAALSEWARHRRQRALHYEDLE